METEDQPPRDRLSFLERRIATSAITVPDLVRLLEICYDDGGGGGGDSDSDSDSDSERTTEVMVDRKVGCCCGGRIEQSCVRMEERAPDPGDAGGE